MKPVNCKVYFAWKLRGPGNFRGPSIYFYPGFGGSRFFYLYNITCSGILITIIFSGSVIATFDYADVEIETMNLN